jgi:bacterial/archaeal transporter family-2 protein
LNWISYLLALAAGAANPAQSAANAQLKKTLDDPVWAGIAVYVSGLCAMLLLQLIVREAWPLADRLGRVPWWAWLGGLLSIASTMAGLTYAQKMGSGVFTGISVTASLVTSIVLDHFGVLGLKEHPASAMRIAGGVLMVAGLWLIAKF